MTCLPGFKYGVRFKFVRVIAIFKIGFIAFHPRYSRINEYAMAPEMTTISRFQICHLIIKTPRQGPCNIIWTIFFRIAYFDGMTVCRAKVVVHGVDIIPFLVRKLYPEVLIYFLLNGYPDVTH